MAPKNGVRRKRNLLMEKRKCVECGASLTDEDVMKIKIEDGSWADNTASYVSKLLQKPNA